MRPGPFGFAVFFGGEDATRTHNALRHTTFPMWLLTIRIPLHLFTFPLPLDNVCYYTGRTGKNQEKNAKKMVFSILHNFNFLIQIFNVQLVYVVT